MNTSSRVQALEDRRRLLQAKVHQQRAEVSELTVELAHRLAWVDTVIDAAAWLRRHPLLVAAPALLLAVWRPSRVVRLGSVALTLWRAANLLRGPGPRT